MDTGVTVALALAGLGWASGLAMAIYALVLRNRTANAETARDVAIGKQRLTEAEKLSLVTELAHAETRISRLESDLEGAHLAKGALYELLAKAGVVGAADHVDDRIAELYADEDRGTPGPGGDGAGRLPDRGAAAAGEAEADLLSEDRPSRPRGGDLL